MKKIRILLADDHPVVRAGVRAFLEDEPDMLIVGEAPNACQAVALAQELQPDVAVVDISMPGGGLDATRQIRSACPGTQVLILTFHTQEHFLFSHYEPERQAMYSNPRRTRNCSMRFGLLRREASFSTLLRLGCLWNAIKPSLEPAQRMVLSH
jgi:DNA-binding NarL/FixJ family response regulator